MRDFSLLFVNKIALVGLILSDLSLQVPLLDPLLARVKLHTRRHRLKEAEVAIGESRWFLLDVAPSLVKGIVSLIHLGFMIILTFAQHLELLVLLFRRELSEQT